MQEEASGDDNVATNPAQQKTTGGDPGRKRKRQDAMRQPAEPPRPPKCAVDRAKRYQNRMKEKGSEAEHVQLGFGRGKKKKGKELEGASRGKNNVDKSTDGV